MDQNAQEGKVAEMAISLSNPDVKELSFTLPIGGKKFTMVRSSGRIQMIAEKQYAPAKEPFFFFLACVKQTLTPQPATIDEMLDYSNEDLDFVSEMYNRFNRAGKYAITQKEVEGFFVIQSPSK